MKKQVPAAGPSKGTSKGLFAPTMCISGTPLSALPEAEGGLASKQNAVKRLKVASAKQKANKAPSPEAKVKVEQPPNTPCPKRKREAQSAEKPEAMPYKNIIALMPASLKPPSTYNFVHHSYTIAFDGEAKLQVLLRQKALFVTQRTDGTKLGPGDARHVGFGPKIIAETIQAALDEAMVRMDLQKKSTGK